MSLHAKILMKTSIMGSIYRNRDLVLSLIWREVAGRYRGSIMGVLWAFINPLLMLTVYAFVFGVVFKARWSRGEGSQSEFALILFAGLMVYNVFAECINRAPMLVVENANYVKKVVFPLEVLPVVMLGGALFHFLVSLLVWLIGYLCLLGVPHVTGLLLPLVLLPLMLLTLGVSWFLASLGVYLRDIRQVVGVFTSVLLFISPIFYAMESLPKSFHILLLINPITMVVEWVRSILVFGENIDWVGWIGYMLIASAVFFMGGWWFQKTRKGFSDVL